MHGHILPTPQPLLLPHCICIAHEHPLIILYARNLFRQARLQRSLNLRLDSLSVPMRIFLSIQLDDLVLLLYS